MTYWAECDSCLLFTIADGQVFEGVVPLAFILFYNVVKKHKPEPAQLKKAHGLIDQRCVLRVPVCTVACKRRQVIRQV